MAMHTGVSARALCKPSSSPSLSRSSSSSKLVRRRGRGSLVRSRAFIWSKEDLQKLHQLANKPRHDVTPDVIDCHILSKSPILTPEHSSSTDPDEDLHPHMPFPGAVDQHPALLQTPVSRNDVSHSVNPAVCSHHTAATTSKPPLQRTHEFSKSAHPTHYQLPAHSHHPAMPRHSTTNQPNLAVVSGLAARLIDLTL